jgi:serine/threonine protein kinase
LDGGGKVEMGIAMELLTGESMSALRDKYRDEICARTRRNALISAIESGNFDSFASLLSLSHLMGSEAAPVHPGIHVSVAAYLTSEMLGCLRELHARGVVHRDIKPSNFVRRDRKSTKYCLIDFGLVKKVIVTICVWKIEDLTCIVRSYLAL